MAEESSFEQKRKYWEQLRNAIVHEDNLVNHRLTWTLTIEGFLLTGLFLVQNSVLSNKLSLISICLMEVLLIVVFVGVASICLISGSMIAAAFGQIALIRRAWHEKYPEEKPQSKDKPALPKWFWTSGVLSDDAGPSENEREYPPIMGDFAYSWFNCSQRIPSILFFINVLKLSQCRTTQTN